MDSTKEEAPGEIILVDKPAGMTSFDVIRSLRRTLGIRKMGHAGTLDPMATGLMIIGTGKATKELAHLIKLDKTYEAQVLLGIATDTGDIEGKIVEESEPTSFDTETISKAVESLVGTNRLLVPAFSAIKRDGKRLYESAHKGIPVERPERDMHVYEAQMTGISDSRSDKRQVVSVTFSVASGVYIRSIAEELGRRLGVPACLCALRRTVIGQYSIADARQI